MSTAQIETLINYPVNFFDDARESAGNRVGAMKDYAASLWVRYTRLITILNVAFVTSTVARPIRQTDARKSAPRNPVVLVHGLNDSSASMKTMKQWLTSHGWSVFAINLAPSDGSVALEDLAHQLAAYIDTTFPRNQR